MSRRRAALLLGPWALGCALAFAQSVAPAGAADADPDDDELRARLTEREDKRRPPEPWSADVAGRPLTLGGEYSFDLGTLRRRVVGPAPGESDRLLLEQELEAEAFYSFGAPLSLFAQLRVAMQEDLLPDTPDAVSDYFVERGEMWLYSEQVGGSRLDLDLGRLHFEDERRWWWDDDLDAVRIAYEGETLEIAVALARELGPERSDHDFVEPENDRVLRILAEASWEWLPNHALELFLLHQDDHSPAERPGEQVSSEREDGSDARLDWLGARLMGVVELRSRGLLGYWLDTALVGGREQLVEFEELYPGRSVAEGQSRRDVRGWALDTGMSWILPLAGEPRLFGGYAFGSGDASPEAGDDRAFRQTGIQANEAGFGGVERFPHYGFLLHPELSNLQVATLGAGLSLLRSSSLDLVYHHYRLVEPAPSLRDAGLEAELTGEQRDLGDEIDLVLALEEWQRLEFEAAASAFRAGRAFGAERGAWSYGGFLAVRFAF